MYCFIIYIYLIIYIVRVRIKENQSTKVFLYLKPKKTSIRLGITHRLHKASHTNTNQQATTSHRCK